MRSHGLLLPVKLSLLLVTILALGTLSPHQLRAGGAAWPLLFDSDFSANTHTGWLAGHSSYYDEHVAQGQYILRVGNGRSRIEGPHPPLYLADGRISATVRLDGNGLAGLAARVNQTDSTGYTFWIARDGHSGASRIVDGSETSLFTTYAGNIVPDGGNVLSLQVAGSLLIYVVNGRPVFSYVDHTPLPAGNWGMYVSNATNTGRVQGRYSRITIYGRSESPDLPVLSAYPFTPLVDYDFSLGDNGSWTTSSFTHARSVIAHGRLTISTTNNYSYFVDPVQAASMKNGQIAAILRLQGRGRVGVAGRWIQNPRTGFYSAYVCWIDWRGDVGLTRENNTSLITPFELHDASIHPYTDTVLALRIQGNQIRCFAGGKQMFRYVDPNPLRSGTWGALVSAYPGKGYAQGQYRHILIAG
jgi:hypothetical protein